MTKADIGMILSPVVVCVFAGRTWAYAKEFLRMI